MSKLSFKNFRGFIDFPEMEFGGVTFLVGKNNSGKSTAIRSMQLILDYLNSYNLFKLNLDDIGAFNDLINRESKDDFITFKYEQMDFIYELTIYKRTYNMTQNRIKLKIEDIKNGVIFNIADEEYIDVRENYFYPYIYLSCKNTKLNGTLVFKMVPYLNFNKMSMQGLMSIVQRGLLQICYNYNHQDCKSSIYDNKEKDSDIIRIINRNYSESIMYKSDGIDEISIAEDMAIVKKMIKSADKFIGIGNHINYPEFELIKSQIITIPKSNVFKSKDGGLGLILSYFYENHIEIQLIQGGVRMSSTDEKGNLIYDEREKEDVAKTFILKWMSKDYFNLGDDFEIQKVGEDSYSVFIIKGNQKKPISEMGLGAIRIIYTLFSLAIALFLGNQGFGRGLKWLFVFEEPELNLHPAWQSKLADLFYEVNKISESKVQIVLETHSEYLIRRSQVLVAENKLEVQPNQNPFRIYYFNDEGDKKPYQIEYDEDGFLKKGFGAGFFDEATSSTLELMRLRKVKLN